MSKYSCVVWDWNGTLLDDVEVNIRTINRLLTSRGLPTVVGVSEYRAAFDFPIIEYYKRLNFDLEREDFNLIAEEYVRAYTKEVQSAVLFDGVQDTLAKIGRAGVRQVIVSAAETDRLRREVSSYGIDGYFTDILGVSDNLGGSKVDVGRRFVSECGCSPEKVLFVGDFSHDHAVASSCGCDCAIVTNGHQSRERLKSLPVTLLSDVREVAKLVL